MSTLSVHQHKFATSTIRTLKKLKDAGPFKFPVDPLALNIPHYPQVIKEPMDFSTIERKLASSNPVKPDPDPTHARYYNAEEFITDVRRIFQNCLTFNGPDHAITQSGRRVEATFDKQIKQMPATEAVSPFLLRSALFFFLSNTRSSCASTLLLQPPYISARFVMSNICVNFLLDFVRTSDVQSRNLPL